MDQDPRYRADPQSSFSPGSNFGRRTAGSGSGTQTGDGDSVRDWQKNTWFGPAPADPDPFDEPESAPELRESRSENVNERVGDFWNQQTTGYQYTGEIPGPQQAGTAKKRREPRKKKEMSTATAVRIVLILLAVLAAAFLILRYAVFCVRNITIIGNSSIPAADVIAASGIRTGDSILSLDEETVKTRLESDWRLQFRYMEKNLPSQVIISVREREECCWLTYGGIIYTMDKNRMVMFESEDLENAPGTLDSLVEVRGLGIRSGSRVGQTMVLTSHSQELAFSELFLEMKVLGCRGRIQEADLSNVSSILLMTRDGYTVSMGDSGNIHAKLRAALLVMERLKQMDLSGGTINVSNPETPFYSPADD